MKGKLHVVQEKSSSFIAENEIVADKGIEKMQVAASQWKQICVAVGHVPPYWDRFP